MMDASFWRERWETNTIAFHEGKPNASFVKYFDELKLAKGSRIFIPLCGKTLDIHWLLSQGCRVAGAELSRIAIEQLFAELKLKAEITRLGKLDRYQAKNIDMFVGDLFDLSAKQLGPVDAVYDRAALVALPETMRAQYVAHLIEMTSQAPQLLISFVYDQGLMEGPPFSVNGEKIKQYYRDSYRISLLASENLAGGIKGHPVKEEVWLLKNTKTNHPIS